MSILNPVALLVRPSEQQPLSGEVDPDQERPPADYPALVRECDALEAVLKDPCGCETVQLAINWDLPDSTYCGDIFRMIDGVGVQGSMRHIRRRQEVPAVMAAVNGYVDPARIIKVQDIAPDAYLEHGDVVTDNSSRLVFVGINEEPRKARSNLAGANALQTGLSTMGSNRKVVPMPFHGCMHLADAVSWVKDDTLLVNTGWVRWRHRIWQFRRRWLKLLEVPAAEPWGAAAFRVKTHDCDLVIVPEECPKTALLLQAYGCEVVKTPFQHHIEFQGVPGSLCIMVSRKSA